MMTMKQLKNFISQMLLKISLNSITIKYVLLLILQYVVMFIIAFLTDRVLEWFTMIPLFFIYTRMYSKQYHCKTLINCSIVTVCVFGISCIIMPSKNEFLFSSVIIMYVITTVSYYVKDYLDKTAKLSKKLESMTLDEMRERYTKYTEYELKAVYAYINRGDKLADNIAMKYNYSTRQLQRMVKQMKDDL